MKTLILAGGYGSRLGSLTDLIPKPMVPIGGKPILWHIMKLYAAQGFKDFVLLLGYRGDRIKDYFYHHRMLSQDFTLDMNSGDLVFHPRGDQEDWKVTLVDTGESTLKGGRIKRAEGYLDGDEHFLTYGDGVADVDLNALLAFHRAQGRLLTLSGVRPPSRFGELRLEGSRLRSFEEKPQVGSGLINGGFMVFHRDLLGYLNPGEDCDFEFGVLEELARQDQVAVWTHPGSWECVDTERDLAHLNRLWSENRAFWKIWG